MEEWKTSLSGDLKFLARFTSCDGSIKVCMYVAMFVCTYFECAWHYVRACGVFVGKQARHYQGCTNSS